MKETYGLDTYQIIIGRLFIASKKELLIRRWNEIKMIEPYIFDKEAKEFLTPQIYYLKISLQNTSVVDWNNLKTKQKIYIKKYNTMDEIRNKNGNPFLSKYRQEKGTILHSI